MKKMMLIPFLIAGMFFTSQLIAQTETKTSEPRQQTEKKEVNKTGKENVKTGQTTKEATQGTVTTKPPATAQPGTKPDTRTTTGKDPRTTTTKTGTDVQGTKTPVQETKAPAQGTKTPVQGTKAPAQGTTAPAKAPATTGDPAVSTKIAVGQPAVTPPSKKIYDTNGKAKASVEYDGTIKDAQGRVVGKYTETGDFIGITGEKIGSVEKNKIRDREGADFGKIGKDGTVYTTEGKMLGKVSADGTVTNSEGTKIGSAPGIDRNIAAMMFFYPKQQTTPSVKESERK